MVEKPRRNSVHSAAGARAKERTMGRFFVDLRGGDRAGHPDAFLALLHAAPRVYHPDGGRRLVGVCDMEEAVKKLYCTICQQQVPEASWKRHVESGEHEKNLLRIALGKAPRRGSALPRSRGRFGRMSGR